MALTPVQNDALIREIDEAVRQDSLQNFWARFGLWVVGAIIAGLLAFGGWLFWQNQQQRNAEAAGENFSQLIASVKGNQADEAKLSALSTTSQPGYRVGALLTRAALETGRNQNAAAIATYGSIAGDTTLAQPYRDLAIVRQTALEFDSLPPQTVIDRLRPLAMAGNPWFGSAGELSALAQLKLGKRDAAGALFAALAKDADVPRTVQTRAVQIASLLGVDAQLAAKPGETKENATNAQ